MQRMRQRQFIGSSIGNVRRATARLSALCAAAALVAALLVSPAFADEPRRLPADYPPEYGAAFPLAVLQTTFGLAFFPLVALPAVAFDGTEAVEELWDRLVADPVDYVVRDRAGNRVY